MKSPDIVGEKACIPAGTLEIATIPAAHFALHSPLFFNVPSL